MDKNNNSQLSPNNDRAGNVRKGDYSPFLPGVRNKKMQSQYNTLLAPRKYDIDWLNNTLSDQRR